MKQGEDFQATFGDNTLDKNQAWAMIEELLSNQNLAELTYDQMNKKYSFEKIASAIRKYPKPHYGIETETFHFDFSNVSAGYGLFTTKEKVDKNIDWSKWVQPLAREPKFIQAFFLNREYRFWQDMDDTDYYESQGRPHAHLPKIRRNIPPPLDDLLIDISNNPGRYVVRSGYVEAVAAEMWLGPAFWERTGAKREDVLTCDFFTAEEKENNVIHITTGLRTFTSGEGEEAELQNKMRRLLYPNSVDRPIDQL